MLSAELPCFSSFICSEFKNNYIKISKWPSWSELISAHLQLSVWLAHIRRLVNRPFPISMDSLLRAQALLRIPDADCGKLRELIAACSYRSAQNCMDLQKQDVQLWGRWYGLSTKSKKSFSRTNNVQKCELRHLSETLILSAVVFSLFFYPSSSVHPFVISTLHLWDG